MMTSSKRVSREHGKNYSSLGSLEDVDGLGVVHALQTVSVHSNDLIPALQPAILYGCPLLRHRKGKSINIMLRSEHVILCLLLYLMLGLFDFA